MMPPRVPTYHSASEQRRASASFGRSMPLSAARVSAATTVSAEDELNPAAAGTPHGACPDARMSAPHSSRPVACRNACAAPLT